MTSLHSIIRNALLPLGVAALVGCGADRVSGPVDMFGDASTRSVALTVGQELDVILGNVGPGEYDSPPQLSSAGLTYLGVDVIPPFSPAGPTQRFRFTAAASGQVIVAFTRTLDNSVMSVVIDTVVVR